MMLVNRLQHMGAPHDLIIFTGFLVYIAIRFGVSAIFKHYTVHRGMWHSLPAAATCGLLTFLLVAHESVVHRYYMAGAVVLGFMVHLVLDEIWSIQWKGGAPRLKKSFGTAIKLWSKSWWGNLSTYGKLAAVITSYSIHYTKLYDSRRRCSPPLARRWNGDQNGAQAA